MSRRGRGEGSITRRKDGRWQATYVGSDRRKHYLYAHKREEVATKLNATLAAKAAGVYVAGTPKSLGEYLPTWLAEHAIERDLKPGTVKRYRGLIDNHIVPALGDVKVHALTTKHLDDLYAHLRATGRNRPLSSSSINQVNVVLHGVLDHARRRQLIRDNIVADVRRPKPSTTRTMIILSPHESRALLDATAHSEMGTLYAMALHTGMRQGEMLALRWQDVNLQTGWIDVNGTLSRHDGEWRRGSPKSKAGIRRIKITASLTDRLGQHQEWQRERHRALGHEVIESTYIFTDAAGQPINGFHVTERQFKPLLATLGLPMIRFHDLRHAFVSTMLSLRVRIDLISKMLGHSKPSITLDIYAHLIPGDQEEAVALLDQALSVSTGDVKAHVEPEFVLNQEAGSGGRIRTTGQGLMSPLLYH